MGVLWATEAKVNSICYSTDNNSSQFQSGFNSLSLSLSFSYSICFEIFFTWKRFDVFPPFDLITSQPNHTESKCWNAQQKMMFVSLICSGQLYRCHEFCRMTMATKVHRAWRGGLRLMWAKVCTQNNDVIVVGSNSKRQFQVFTIVISICVRRN